MFDILFIVGVLTLTLCLSFAWKYVFQGAWGTQC